MATLLGSIRSKRTYRRKIHAYLRTDVWAVRSRRFRALMGWRCARCGLISKRNHAHHLTYRHAFRGLEPDTDLMCLCPGCHSLVHDYSRQHPSLTLRRATMIVLRKNKI